MAIRFSSHHYLSKVKLFREIEKADPSVPRAKQHLTPGDLRHPPKNQATLQEIGVPS